MLSSHLPTAPPCRCTSAAEARARREEATAAQKSKSPWLGRTSSASGTACAARLRHSGTNTIAPPRTRTARCSERWMASAREMPAATGRCSSALQMAEPRAGSESVQRRCLGALTAEHRARLQGCPAVSVREVRRSKPEWALRARARYTQQRCTDSTSRGARSGAPQQTREQSAVRQSAATSPSASPVGRLSPPEPGRAR